MDLLHSTCNLIFLGRYWNFPCYLLLNSVLFFCILCWTQKFCNFSATPLNFTKILQNPWHSYKMRKKQWKFRKFCVILIHQILQILPPNCKFLCYPLIPWATGPKFCNSVFFVNSVLSSQFREFCHVADTTKNSSPCLGLSVWQPPDVINYTQSINSEAVHAAYQCHHCNFYPLHL